jgi:FAD/FMN-containing dehydrogenase
MLSMPDLSDQLQGRVITPEDSDYDQARTVFVGGVDRRPAAVVRVADASDVARVIAIARDGGLELAVRSGGHSGAGHGVSEGGLVIDLADMRALEIDPDARTAWAEAGLTAGEYTTGAGSHGLATGFGDAGSVGIGGLTLGGGVGLLARKHGLTIDDLLGAEVATADGEVLRVDADNHPDLFWAIRGGGGNFGVVTRFHYRLHAFDEIVGGMLFLPATPEVIAGFVAEADAAPEELSAVANVMPAPPLPFIPAEQHGRLVIMALIAHVGPVEEGERAVAQLRALADPVGDMVRPMKYPEIYQPAEEGYHPTAASRTLFLDGLDQRAAETIVERIEARPGQMAATQLRVLGGAVARVPAEATAFAHRHRKVMVNVAALYQQPDERAAHEAWVAETADALSDGAEGAYVAFLGDEGEERVREAYPGATWDRLAEIKARYDPDNLFRLNQNIPPAAG